MNREQQTMKLVVESGNARSLAMEAINSAKSGNIQEARRLYGESEKALTEAHKIQTDILQDESDGAEGTPSMLMMHAQDHLMSAILLHDLSLEFIDLYERIGKGCD
jgi:cellobiose PTS system EIIA component